MGVFTKNYRVSISDADRLGRLRMSSLFRMLQEVATEHAAGLGLGTDETRERGVLWVVTAQRCRIHRMPAYQEELVVSTWPGVTTHAFFPRFYRLESPAGELLAEASALWVLMDSESRKMILPGKENFNLDGQTVTGTETGLPTPPRMGEFTGEGSFTVPRSYLDLNGHMNNVRYFDLCEDLLPQDLEEREPEEVVIKYGGEALLGEKMELKTGREGNAWFLSGDSGGRRVFRVRMEYGSN